MGAHVRPREIMAHEADNPVRIISITDLLVLMAYRSLVGQPLDCPIWLSSGRSFSDP